MEKQKMFLKDGKLKSLLEGWKIKNSSRRMENQKIFLKDGKLKNLLKDGNS